MKLSIISDTHFGDDSCQLVTKRSVGSISEGPKYQDFVKAAHEGNDYLILAGDVFDFSIANYATAYEYGKAFFQFLKRDGIAKEIIYLAGNHDADIWHIVQHQRSVIKRIIDGKPPKQFEHSVAGIIDDRKATTSQYKGLTLNRTTVRTIEGGHKYGGMFLDEITGKDTPTNFNFVYPNLYIVTDKETVLVTHGQYLEAAWAIIGELGSKIAYDDLKVDKVDVEEMVEMNFPLNQLLCTGVGQAGVLTSVVRQVQLDVKNHNLKRPKKYLDRLENEIGVSKRFIWPISLVVDFGIGKAKEALLKKIGGIEQARNNADFPSDESGLVRLEKFYASSLLEIDCINQRTGQNIPTPLRIIFGHTHCPISWKNPSKLPNRSSLPPELLISDGGGWIVENNKFCGAEVFTYDTEMGFGSVSIR